MTLAESISRSVIIPHGEIDRLAAALSPVAVPKGGVFIAEGGDGARFGFVERGLFRFFYLLEDGREATRAFIREGGFLMARVSFARGEPAPYTIPRISRRCPVSPR